MVLLKPQVIHFNVEIFIAMTLINSIQSVESQAIMWFDGLKFSPES